jgi:hypothetical protein
MGHTGAKVAVERERARLEQEAVKRNEQNRNAEMVLDIFGGFLKAIPRQ